MTRYVVLLPGDEASWENATEEARQQVYGLHEEFARQLAERGHTIVSGAELTHSREAKVVRRSGEQVEITDGPYAESVEQLTGFYMIDSDDLDDLLQVVAVLAPTGGDEPVDMAHAPIEVRATTHEASE
ncbi:MULTISPECIES: YciI family protein [unclassified Nocardioides]|uniref:YciI family protein n=1 Tax=unclassified Nocardioides TaxID=2615069 RepID=UPI0009E9F49D|nr:MULTISPECIES: YciI family protein [unclassified Nocardioides]